MPVSEATPDAVGQVDGEVRVEIGEEDRTQGQRCGCETESPPGAVPVHAALAAGRTSGASRTGRLTNAAKTPSAIESPQTQS